MDLARVDTLGIALVVVAARLAGREAPLGWGRGAGLGFLLCAAIYTKQTNVVYAVWILVFAARRSSGGALWAAAVAVSLSIAALVLLQRASHGWFWTWVTSMRHQGVVPGRCLMAAMVVVPSALAFGVAYVALDRRGWLRDATRLWCGMLGAAVPASMGWLNPGGWINNLIGLVLIALLAVMLLTCDALHGIRTEASVLWATATLSAFLAGAIYDPSTNVPNEQARRDAEDLHAMVRSLDDDVLVPMYPFVAARDGKTSAQLSLVEYLCTIGPGRINADAASAIREKHPKWVLLFGHPAQERDIPAWLGSRYMAEPLDLHVQALKQMTGGRMTLLRRTESGT